MDEAFDNKSKVNFTQLKDTLNKLILIDSFKILYAINSFISNLNMRILPNDGYLGAGVNKYLKAKSMLLYHFYRQQTNALYL